MGKRAIAVIFILLITSAACSLDTFDGLLSGEFWVELDPLISTEGGLPLGQDEVAAIALEEARYVFSSMIYGYSFRYVPLDRTRRVEEEFSLDPIAEIPWGDPSLTVAEVREHGNLYYVLVRFAAKDHQIKRIESWRSNMFPSAKAQGSALQLGGREAKYEAISAAAKEAIRAHFRGETRNKPKEIAGELVFVEPPYCHLDGGDYIASLTVKIKLDELVPYRTY